MNEIKDLGIIDSLGVGCWVSLIIVSVFIAIVPEEGLRCVARRILSETSGFVFFFTVLLFAVGSLIEKIYLLLNALIKKNSPLGD